MSSPSKRIYRGSTSQPHKATASAGTVQEKGQRPIGFGFTAGKKMHPHSGKAAELVKGDDGRFRVVVKDKKRVRTGGVHVRILSSDVEALQGIDLDNLVTFGGPKSKRKITFKPAKVPELVGAKPIADQARILGLRLGAPLSEQDATKAFASIVSSSTDLFGSKRSAEEFLGVDDFDGTGKSGRELIREGRAARILTRLEDLRFGSRG